MCRKITKHLPTKLHIIIFKYISLAFKYIIKGIDQKTCHRIVKSDAHKLKFTNLHEAKKSKVSE